jgi:hypothetical protein
MNALTTQAVAVSQSGTGRRFCLMFVVCGPADGERRYSPRAGCCAFAIVRPLHCGFGKQGFYYHLWAITDKASVENCCPTFLIG